MDFSVPQINSNIPLEGNAPPDFLAQFIKGQMASYQVPMAQMELQRQALGLQQGQQNLQIGQQQLEKGPLELEQLRMMLHGRELMAQAWGGGAPSAGTPGSNAVAAPGGVQSGPQPTADTGPTQASGSYGGAPAGTVGFPAGFNPQQYGAAIAYSGGDPFRSLQEVQNYSLQQLRLKAQGPLDSIDQSFGSAAPARTMFLNPSQHQYWAAYAALNHFDPMDRSKWTDDNARAAYALAGNTLRGQTFQDAKAYPIPLQNVNLGQGEVGQFDSVTGKKEGDLIDRQQPTFEQQDVWDPVTDTTVKKPVQIGGYGMSGLNPTGGVTSIGPAHGGAPGLPYDTKAPDSEMRKAAGLAQYYYGGLQELQKIESQGGYTPSPKARAIMISAATSDADGLRPQMISQWAAKYGLSQQDQAYMAALMPIMQGAGHSMAGARLTAGQMRANFEGLIPLDTANTEALGQINRNRMNYLGSLGGEAGNALKMPRYAQVAQAVGQLDPATKIIAGKTYRRSGGKWYAD